MFSVVLIRVFVLLWDGGAWAEFCHSLIFLGSVDLVDTQNPPREGRGGVLFFFFFFVFFLSLVIRDEGTSSAGSSFVLSPGGR